MTTVGPDLVIAGAARSGTSTLAAALREHPAIDPGTTKEPNYFSRHYERGSAWYDGLYAPRAEGLLRMDASTSYTYPQFPEALARLARESPEAHVVYVLREPVARAVSHYQLRRHTLQVEEATTFGAALMAGSYYTDVSDYRHWVARLQETFTQDRVLLVPFRALTAASHDVASVICQRMGLGPPPLNLETVTAHRNNVVEFRGTVAHKAAKALRRSRVYPRVRAAVGATGVRQIRSRMIKSARLPTLEEALATCSTEQRTQLATFRAEVEDFVGLRLAEQDAATGLSWSRHWPSGGQPARS
ncbi:MAG: sulfotransferase domain-containing protein [Actinomycetota bacterium]|nr:sulfotransferase domain-containing protein [Actinomycetota bacterium]